MKEERVAVLGASSKTDRYSYKAVQSLIEHDYAPIPISVRDPSILGFRAYPEISAIEGPIDTLTVYVNPKVLLGLTDDIIAAGPKRVILNPGTESDSVKQRLTEAGIRVIEACTLVLLKTGQFSKV